MWGGAAHTPVNTKEMTPLRPEHAGSIAVLIITHILQIVTEVEVIVRLWVDNSEVLRRIETQDVTELTLDYDLYIYSTASRGNYKATRTTMIQQF